MRLRRARCVTAFALMVPLQAQSADLCERVAGWMAGDAAQAEMILPTAATPPICGTSLALSGATSVHCAWGYPYRADAARAAFDDLAAQLNLCFEEGETVSKDQIVNHPDSYDLLEFEGEKGRLGLSLKDKGARQETFIFLRAERANAD